MYTPKKIITRVLNNSFTPVSTLASSKVSSIDNFEQNSNSSLSKKKFSRKNDSSTDSLKRFKKVETEMKINRKIQKQSQQNVEESCRKADSFLERLKFQKQKVFNTKYVKIDTDRSKEDQLISVNSSILRERPMASRKKYDYAKNIKTETIDYEMELEMKNSQFMILEDENNRLKNNIKTKDIEFAKEKQQILINYEKKMKALIQKNNKLEGELCRKDQEIIKSEKYIQKLQENLRKCKNEIDMLKLYIDQYMNKKLPKNTLQIQSYRQKSLQNQLIELKRQLNLNQCEKNKLIESELNIIKQKMTNIFQQKMTLEIANRTLSKKVIEADEKMEAKFKQDFNDLKQKMKVLLVDNNKIKKENLKIRKSMIQYESKGEKRICKNWSSKKNRQNLESSEDSFSFSLSR